MRIKSIKVGENPRYLLLYHVLVSGFSSHFLELLGLVSHLFRVELKIFHQSEDKDIVLAKILVFKNDSQYITSNLRVDWALIRKLFTCPSILRH